MGLNLSNRRETLSTVVLLLVVSLAVQVSAYFPEFQQLPLIVVVTLLTSKGMYELVTKFLFWIINKSDLLLKIYWGDEYIKGLWSYEYLLSNKTYFGVWDIRQDVNGASIIGNGLDDEFRVRTMVRSVSPLIEESGGYFFINSRNELNNNNAQVFSKTTLLLDRPTGFLKGVRSMRAITVVYGGPSDQQLHPNVVFRRHDDVSSIEDLVNKLKSKNVAQAAGISSSILATPSLPSILPPTLGSPNMHIDTPKPPLSA